MAHYTDPYRQYDPGLILSLRLAPEGGNLRQQVQESFRNKIPRTQRELVLLVHGYNNHAAEAEQAYTAFRSGKARDIASESDALQEAMGDAFWPGDAKWPGPVDYLDFLFYPKAVENAQKAAAKFVEYLRTRDDVIVLHMVGHSLGCRVVLEIIRLLQDEGGPIVGKVCLMAAAVPTFKTAHGGELYQALQTPTEVLILFSESDPVLEWGFPPGQTLAKGDEGFFPSAVGRGGDVPSNAGRLVTTRITDAVHSDYWGVKDDEASKLSCAATSAFLSNAPKPRQQPARAVSRSRTAPIRDVAESRTLPNRG